ncbi:MAG: hypothetical protein H6697_00350 [Myxococcales bacterium]|nr:hypothetical protein [Myxococcales bacterium]MCB9520041.1 hypothetical protein [Myxococcales bacterium]
MQEVDYLIIGAGPAGLVLWKLLEGRSVAIVDRSPAGYKIGESFVPEFFSHPLLGELVGSLQGLPSASPKDGTTFIGGGSVASFPLPAWSADHPASIHLARAELERLMIDRWGVPVVEARVSSVDVESRVVATDTGTYRVRRQILDCSGPAMVVARAVDDVHELWPVYARWAYFDIDALDDGEFWRALERDGTPLSRYDTRDGRLIGGRATEGWAPSRSTILNRVRDGVWIWQIPLYDRRLLSLGVVSRHGPVSEEELAATARDHVAPCYRLKRRPPGREPYDKEHVRNRFAQRATVAATDAYILVGDAFAFADPVYSVGGALAVNKAIEVAALLLDGDGWNDEKCARYCETYDALYARAIQAFDYWYSGEVIQTDAEASEVQSNFLEGTAFQVDVVRHYGGVLNDVAATARLEVNATSEVAALLPALPTATPGAPTWKVRDAARSADGLRLTLESAGRPPCLVHVGVDEHAPCYRAVGRLRLSYLSAEEQFAPGELSALFDALEPRLRARHPTWARLATPQVAVPTRC